MIINNMKVRKELPSQLKKETAKRLRRLRREFDGDPELKVFENTEGYDQMICLMNIEFSALCEHHKISFGGIAHVGYVAKDLLVGVSKLARVVESCLNPTVCTLQERATQQIMKKLKEALEPIGIMVVVKAKHGCVGYRGVKKPASIMVTSAVDGCFRDNTSGARSEFLALVAPQEKQLN
jgi:GTP cyclohydrolase I